MNNLYSQTRIVPFHEFQKIENALYKAWSKDTTYPDTKEQWSERNKASGQCAPTSLVIYDLFGGRLIYDKTNFHIWNELPDGTQLDFSRTQFEENREFKIYKYKTRDDVLYDENAQRTNMLERYTLLKQNFQKTYNR
jgi:hypothetical protein